MFDGSGQRNIEMLSGRLISVNDNGVMRLKTFQRKSMGAAKFDFQRDALNSIEPGYIDPIKCCLLFYVFEEFDVRFRLAQNLKFRECFF